MTPELTSQVATGLLLSCLVGVLALGLLATIFIVLYLRHRHTIRVPAPGHAFDLGHAPFERPTIFENTCRWVAVQSSHLSAVQAALALHNATPCSWGEGLSRLTDRRLFVAPPIQGWILILGQGLPDPGADIDQCFHFVTRLSRALGHVQFFWANRKLNHHGWVRADRGHVQRAYVWAGETLWNQGPQTRAEKELGMECFEYGQSPEHANGVASEPTLTNADKVICLAARWSFDPTRIDENALHAGLGISGELLQPH